MLYHIFCDGFRITKSPLTLNIIYKLYGKDIEKRGFILMPIQ